ncbi:MAG: D-isomer specific 2-hydroxyacid dehydrogenase family protein [bacterium]|nr:D-isomer specific 2-hydroxyacid dehydrogenase family protein [bacterium]
MKLYNEKQTITVYSCSDDERALFEQYEQRYNIQLNLYTEDISEGNIKLARGCECISVNHSVRITPSLIDRLYEEGVRYISTRTIGFEHIAVEYAKSIGMEVKNIRYSPNSVADYAIMLILMATRQAKSLLKRTEVQNYSLPRKAGRELQELTIGVVGTGCVGSTLIEHLSGFGTKILAYDVHQKESVKQYATYVTLETLLKESDVITLHMPAKEETKHIINRKTIAMMKDDAYIINTGRGSLIDTEALIEGIESGKLGGAALDVLENELQYLYQDLQDVPLANFEFALLNSFPNVVITPHIAFYTEQAVRDMVGNSIDNCMSFLGESEKYLSENKREELV